MSLVPADELSISGSSDTSISASTPFALALAENHEIGVTGAAAFDEVGRGAPLASSVLVAHEVRRV